ncbi:MAG: SDR family oxidoreductase [Nanoarchaeota archaeon]|nr:SDR family oxidoreductase [Nanoarchaeota archaeon]
MTCLKNKVVVITGASSGIGKAAAIAFSRKGAKIVLAARRAEKLKEIERRLGSSCLAVPADVTQEKEVIALFKKAIQKYGKVDVLINCAGKGLRSGLHAITYEQWMDAIHTNLTSVFLCTREASRAMRATKTRGHIITISSLAGIFNVPGYSGYCCAKHAVTSFKRSVRWELLRHGIRVSIIHPYKVATEFFDDYAKRPNPRRMLSSMDIARYLVAVAERNPLKIVFFATLNFMKRITCLLRF